MADAPPTAPLLLASRSPQRRAILEQLGIPFDVVEPRYEEGVPPELADATEVVREHAQEMSEDVMYRHIDLYVNEYSIDLGADGRRAVELLFEKARETGIVPDLKAELFLRPPTLG